MLDYLATAGFTKTYDQFKEEAPDMVRVDSRLKNRLSSSGSA
jgi:hypothetical protein